VVSALTVCSFLYEDLRVYQKADSPREASFVIAGKVINIYDRTKWNEK